MVTPKRAAAKKSAARTRTAVPTSNAAVLAEWLTPDRRLQLAPGMVRLAESLAEAVDRDTAAGCPECKRSGANAALWREYRITLGELMDALGGDDDGEDSVLAAMRAALGDTAKPRTTNARSGARRGSGQPGPTADAVAAAGRGRRPRAS